MRELFIFGHQNHLFSVDLWRESQELGAEYQDTWKPKLILKWSQRREGQSSQDSAGDAPNSLAWWPK